MSEKNAPPTCPSCGVPFEDHLGLIGTCSQFREAFKALDKISCLVHLVHSDDDADTLRTILGMIGEYAAKSIFRIKNKGKKA